MLFEDFDVEDADDGKFDLPTFDPSEMFLVKPKEAELADDNDGGEGGGVTCHHGTPGGRSRFDPTTLATVSLCDFCPHESVDAADLATHTASSHGRELRRLACPTCGQEFDLYIEISSKEVVPLRGRGKHQCPQCDESFCFKGQLTKHSMTHGPFKCDECECVRLFKDDSSLMRHKVTMHSVPSSRNMALTARCLQLVEETGRPPA